MTLHAHGTDRPRVDPSAFVAAGARIVGDVVVGPESSVWFNAVIRADSSYIRIGSRTNIQDGAVLHTDEGVPCIVGDDCTVGHSAIVHACRVESGSLIGMGAVVLSRAVIGEGSVVAAGALVPEGKQIAPRSLVVGHPARLIRSLTEEEIERLIRSGVRTYVRSAGEYRGGVSDSRT
jgi:carbonic anhydrase/acetyltransferase-like protein (isoleucine patch superfamily)